MPLAPPLSRSVYAELAAAAFTAPVACTHTSEGTADTVVTAPALVFDGVAVVHVEFYAPTFTASLTTFDCNLSLFEDGSPVGEVVSGRAPVAGSDGDSIDVSVRRTPSVGSHTYSVRGWVSAAGTFTVIAGVGGAGAQAPGYVRVVRVA